MLMAKHRSWNDGRGSEDMKVGLVFADLLGYKEQETEIFKATG